jgi:transcriptional regulator with XRE-family HTH domain
MTRPYAPPASDDEAATGGAALRRIRKSRKLTLEQLSQLTGIPTSSLSRIENTRLRLTVDKMHLLAKALDVPVEHLLGEPSAGADDAPGAAARSSTIRTGAGRMTVDRAPDRRPERFCDARSTAAISIFSR